MGTLFPVSAVTSTTSARGQSFHVLQSVWLTEFVTSACCGVPSAHWPAGMSLTLRAWVNHLEAGDTAHALTGTMLASSGQYAYSASPYSTDVTQQWPTLTFSFDPSVELVQESIGAAVQVVSAGVVQNVGRLVYTAPAIQDVQLLQHVVRCVAVGGHLAQFSQEL